MSSLSDATNWAVNACAEAELGDLRRTKRLVELATVLAQNPRASLPEASGDSTMLKAAYRFFAHDAIEPQDIVHSHIEATYGHLDAIPVVLAVPDTTEVTWTSLRATTGLGPLGHPACQGLFVHSTLAITPERVPLGLLAQQVWARAPNEVGKRARRKQRPMTQKESQKWLWSLEAVINAHACCPQTRLVSVGDREADIYDVLAAERPAGVELLIRAAWDRCVSAPQHYVWATVAAQPVVSQLVVHVPRRGTQPAREATLALRYWRLTLCPPRHRQAEGLPAVTLWAVQVHEIEPPMEGEPVEWLLWTTVAVATVEDAIERVQWYVCRWGIEVWHRILKSGCRIEARQFETAERLQRCLTLYSVIAWRVFYATMLARAVPEMPCSVLLEVAEWQALYCAISHCPTPPDEPPTLGEAVRWIAQLGGFVGRRRDQPGADPVHTISIIPRGIGALGPTQQLPPEDRYRMTRHELHGKIDVLFGGGAAEQVVCGDLSTGAHHDLQRATESARAMLLEYDMGDTLGPVTFPRHHPLFLPEHPASPAEGHREYSEATAQALDLETKKRLEERLEHVLQLWRDKRPVRDRIAAVLLAQEGLEGDAFARMVRQGMGDAREAPDHALASPCPCGAQRRRWA